jgi:predicted dehydrogenase/threonine dehydrogenase-like Zn-dependent dehydrogenase
MLQALVRKGKVLSEKVPTPSVSEGCLLIKVVNSCISVGTELGTVSNSGIPLIKRALQQPQNVKKVLDSIRTKGLAKAYAKVSSELEAGKPIGYSLSGVVIAAGSGVEGFEPGDHVTASGAGIANHAEYVDVPKNLVTKIPKDFDFLHASTVTLGAIALQGVRRADLTLGEQCMVLGTGILGLLTIQLLTASGVRVAAVDLDDSRLAIAMELGAELIINSSKEDMLLAMENWTAGVGVDAVLFTAATSSNNPLSQSFKVCRRKGRVVLVGVSGMEVKREDIYKKELDFLISTSYGPGRYDNNYERKGLDYPIAYVRWTENRNMQEYLRLIYSGAIRIDTLISKVFPIEEVTAAYESARDKNQPSLMVILDYGKLEDKELPNFAEHKIKIKDLSTSDKISIAVIGAGSFAVNTHLPNLSQVKDKFVIHTILDHKGANAKNVANQFGAKYATTSFDEVLKDPQVDLVFITTRHDSHASMVLQALKAGKHVFVEKPLAITIEELEKIEAFYEKSEIRLPLLFVGYNRRFSIHAREIKKHTDQRQGPLLLRYRMNAGFIPEERWIHDHGGRIIGEACHLIDLMTFFTESEIESISCESLNPVASKFKSADNKSITLRYKDGSVASVDYFSMGAKSLEKEFMEVHFDGKSIILNDYKMLTGHNISVKNHNQKVAQKGQFEELIYLHKALTEKEATWPIQLWDMFQTTRATILISKT